MTKRETCQRILDSAAYDLNFIIPCYHNNGVINTNTGVNKRAHLRQARASLYFIVNVNCSHLLNSLVIECVDK